MGDAFCIKVEEMRILGTGVYKFLNTCPPMLLNDERHHDTMEEYDRSMQLMNNHINTLASTANLAKLTMTPGDRKRLEEAVELLENPSWTIRLTNLIGMPMEWVVKNLPAGVNEIISKATTSAIQRAIVFAVSTMNHRYRGSPSKRWHKSGVILSGAVGGFFGLAGLAVDLPISTIIILRSIADIARSEGENISSIDTQLACLQVFAFGGRKSSDDSVETAYYGIRTALANIITEASEFIARKGLAEEGAPVIVRLIARIAARFNLVVTEKVAATIVPVIGAASGATINLLFINHFQSIARGHFIIRALERKYSPEIVRNEYELIARKANQ